MGIRFPQDEFHEIPLALLGVGIHRQPQIDLGHPDGNPELSELVQSVPEQVRRHLGELPLDGKGVDWAALRRIEKAVGLQSAVDQIVSRTGVKCPYLTLGTDGHWLLMVPNGIGGIIE